MSENTLLSDLHARKIQIGDEMRVRLDELDRLISLVTGLESPTPIQAQSVSGSRSRRSTKEFKIGDIIERPILNGLLATQTLTTKEMATLLPGKKIGPLVSAWKRRAVKAGVVFDELVKRSTTPTGNVAFSLTDRGRSVFGPVAQR